MLTDETALMFPIVFKLGNGEYEHESVEWAPRADPEAPPVILETVAT